MCEPTTAVMIGTMVVGAVMSAQAAKAQSQARQNEANYQSAVAKNNEVIAEDNAKEIEQEGVRKANKYRANVDRMIAAETLSLVAQGGDIGFGSNVDLLADYAQQGESDAQTILDNSANEAYKMRVQGSQYSAQSTLYGMKASSENPLMAGTSSLLSDASSISRAWVMRG